MLKNMSMIVIQLNQSLQHDIKLIMGFSIHTHRVPFPLSVSLMETHTMQGYPVLSPHTAVFHGSTTGDGECRSSSQETRTTPTEPQFYVKQNGPIKKV